MPATQLDMPVALHAPTPHVVGAGTKLSSTTPSQSSSRPSQSLSLPVGAPGAQLSTTLPLTQERMPVRPHTPLPHMVATGVYVAGSHELTVRIAAELVMLL